MTKQTSVAICASCPAEKSGKRLADLRSVPFEFFPNLPDPEEPKPRRFWFVFGSFNSATDSNAVYTGDVLQSSTVAQMFIRAITNSSTHPTDTIVTDQEHPLVARVKSKLCDRVGNCPGMIKGACGALNGQVVRQVIQEVVSP